VTVLGKGAAASTSLIPTGQVERRKKEGLLDTKG